MVRRPSAYAKAKRNEEFARLRHRCPACGRFTVKRRQYLPVLDERCGPCVKRNFGVKTIAEAEAARCAGESDPLDRSAMIPRVDGPDLFPRVKS